MTNDFKIYLSLISDVLNSTDTTESFEFEPVFNIAREQGTFFILFPVFKRYFDLEKLKVDKDIFENYEKTVSQNIARYVQKQFAVHDVIEKLNAIGVECVMLKGDTLADLYPYSDVRMSNDTDLLISLKNEKKCLAFFKENGCYIKKRTRTNNQSVAVHPKAGTFEIHISMDTKQVAEIWYDNAELVKESYRTVKVAGLFNYKTLGITDTALNLILHVVKHYISGITHMRMITDTVLFMDRYWKSIDFERVEKQLTELKYITVYECLKVIGGKYLKLKNIMFDEKYDDKSREMLEDIFECGDFGFDKLEEQSYTYNLYSKKRFESLKKGSYKAYKKKILINDTFDLIFKNKYEMMKIYPVLQKKQYLLFFMYVHRFFTCIFHGLFGKKKAVSLTDEKLKEKEFFDKRMDVLNKMNMI